MANITNSSTPKYFPVISFQRPIGFVKRISMVPIRFSSAKLFIEIAGIRNKNIHGARLKNGFKSAKPLSRILYPPENTNRKNPQAIRNNPITRYPVRVEKKDCISLFSIASILFSYQLSVISCLLSVVCLRFLQKGHFERSKKSKTYCLTTNFSVLNTNYSRLTILSTLQASGFSLKSTFVLAQTFLKSSEFL